MYRRGGIVLLLISVVFAGALLLRTVRSFTGYVIDPVDGPYKTYDECGRADEVLRGRLPADIRTPGAQKACVLEARAWVVTVVIVVSPLVIVGVAAMVRGRRPDTPIDVLRPVA